jgi:SAM-dependent methyltransferase
MAQLSFDDSAAYERFVGTWGRAAGSMFLDWVDPPKRAKWLDVGCGTGLFTELIVENCSPETILGIDPAESQIDFAKRKAVARRAQFRTGDAQALPFEDAAFDVVASALVINFVPDKFRALCEMKRVARPGGMVGGYIWDFQAELSPSGPFRLGLHDVVGDLPALPGTEDSSPARLLSLFEQAGFAQIATTSFDVTVEFPDFDTFWTAQTPSYAPTTKIIAGLEERQRSQVKDVVRSRVQPKASGGIRYTARANAIRAHAS